MANAALPNVLLETSAGSIVLEIDAIRAPITAANFLRYVADGHYDGGHFVRTVRQGRPHDKPKQVDLIQAAARQASNRYYFDAYGPIPLEPTSVTGLSHVPGALSMVREAAADSATSGFFIVLSDAKRFDSGGQGRSDGQGFAVFGRVLSGMDVVKSIHQSATECTAVAGDAFSGEEWLDPPVRILSATVLGNIPSEK